jgi:hypothetical protein
VIVRKPRRFALHERVARELDGQPVALGRSQRSAVCVCGDDDPRRMLGLARVFHRMAVTIAQSRRAARASWTAASHGALAVTGSNSSIAMPPQHWPRLAPSANRRNAMRPAVIEQVARDVDRGELEMPAADRPIDRFPR